MGTLLAWSRFPYAIQLLGCTESLPLPGRLLLRYPGQLALRFTPYGIGTVHPAVTGTTRKPGMDHRQRSRAARRAEKRNCSRDAGIKRRSEADRRIPAKRLAVHPLRPGQGGRPPFMPFSRRAAQGCTGVPCRAPRFGIRRPITVLRARPPGRTGYAGTLSCP